MEGPPRSVSSTRQFVIYSDVPKLRTSVAIQAEDAKRDFLELLREKDTWQIPIILNFGPPPNMKRPPRAQIGIFESDDGASKIQLDVFDPKLVDDPEFVNWLLTALTLEHTYRNTPVKAGRAFEPPPTWFVEGLAERIRSQDTGQPASLYSSMLSGMELPRLDDFLETPTERLDATSRAIYQAQAAALLEAIIDLPDGRAGLRSYLSVPRKQSANFNDLIASLPSVAGNKDTLGRKWVLSIARASAANRINLLTERETGKELDTILAVKALPDPKHPEVGAMSGPYALPTIARSRNGRFILAQLENSLLRLSLNAHPLYKSLVDEYLRIVRELADKPKKKQDKQIAAAEQMRAGLTRETSDLRDYMDWVETTKIKTANPELGKALDNVEEMAKPVERQDAITRYLDAVEDRGQ
jgi:hypothetical protein